MRSTAAFIGGVPGLDHDVIQLVAQEVFDHMLIAVSTSRKSASTPTGASPPFIAPDLEQPPHRVGRVAVLGDHRFQRALLAQGSGVFGAQGIEMVLGFVSSLRCFSISLPQSRRFRR